MKYGNELAAAKDAEKARARMRTPDAWKVNLFQNGASAAAPARQVWYWSLDQDGPHGVVTVRKSPGGYWALVSQELGEPGGGLPSWTDTAEHDTPQGAVDDAVERARAHVEELQAVVDAAKLACWCDYTIVSSDNQGRLSTHKIAAASEGDASDIFRSKHYSRSAEHIIFKGRLEEL
jgi:hypothetical protein